MADRAGRSSRSGSFLAKPKSALPPRPTTSPSYEPQLADVTRGEVSDGLAGFMTTHDGREMIKIAPHDHMKRFKDCVFASPDAARTGGRHTDDLRYAANFRSEIAARRRRLENWPHTSRDRGSLSAPAIILHRRYHHRARKRIPYKSWMRFGGMDFFSDGHTAAICTWSGDVWIVSGIDDKLDHVKWRRFAAGLFQTLGLKIVNDEVYVLGRDQITRLHDLNLATAKQTSMQTSTTTVDGRLKLHEFNFLICVTDSKGASISPKPARESRRPGVAADHAA